MGVAFSLVKSEKIKSGRNVSLALLTFQLFNHSAFQLFNLDMRMKPGFVVAVAIVGGMMAGMDAQAGAVRFDADGALRIEGDATGINWILRSDGSQYPFVTAEDAWGRVVFAGESGEGLDVDLRRREDGDDMIETLTISNTLDHTVRLCGAKVNFPFNDNYPESAECVARRCNAHLWPVGSGAWVCALRMGGEGPHLGWMLTKGEVDGYAISKRGREYGSSNFRGVIAFRLPEIVLDAGNVYTLEWRLFAHAGKDDFGAQLARRGGLFVFADRLVGEVGQTATIRALTGRGGDDAGETLAAVAFDSPGEKNVRVERGDKWTRVELLCVSGVRELIAKRLDFILERQIFERSGDIRDGAYLPYDNETESQYRNWLESARRSDLSEGRERVGFGVALAEAIRDLGYSNGKAMPTLEKYAAFVRNSLQDAEYHTFSDAVHTPRRRFYNYAWIVRFYFDMYDVTGDARYIDHAVGTAKALFRDGGTGFYVIDMPVRQSIETLRRVGRAADAEALLADFRKSADVFAARGLTPPKFEVNYEQSIIAPAADFLCEMYLVTGERKYRDAAMAMLPAADAFGGLQPSWHLNDVAIRHWDGYWFGKRQVWGDTMPHYWSAISASLFAKVAEITGDERWAGKAAGICLANLGLFTEDGRGGCAWIYPDEIDGRQGRFLEPLSNDETYAIAFIARILGGKR